MSASKIAVVLVLTAACLIWVLWGIDWSQIQVSAADANYAYVAPVFGIYLLNHCIRSVRLRLLLDRADIAFSEMFAVTTIGFLAINVVPLRLGEFVRPYLLLERSKVPFGTSFAAVFIERLLDLLGLMTMLLVVGWQVDLPEQGVIVGDVDVFAAGQKVIGTLIGGGMLFLLGLLIIGKPLIALVLRFIPVEPVRVKVEGLLTTFHAGLVGLVKRPGAGLACVALTAVMWMGIVASCYSVMMGFDAIAQTWQMALTTWTITITGMTVAPTPGFFGSYEAFCTASLLLWGVDREVATTYALVLHLTQFGFIVGLGSTYLLKEGISLRQVVADSREAAGS
ncbi:MAG: flippase-like domain-containing protein [Proteobacteria bacterium]|nr:flippase-like domain-containing protein [Pseudomonadota bacterium]MCP4917236.1 flippase-like domain-containing protein [Pseudomonadota bacterium]